MNFFEAIGNCIANYCCFDGRARRSEYWFFTLFVAVLAFIARLVFMYDQNLVKTISTLIEVAFFLPRLSVEVRRLHDIGEKGWAILWGLVPIGGPIYLLVCNCTKGVAGDNEYGPNPKESKEEGKSKD